MPHPTNYEMATNDLEREFEKQFNEVHSQIQENLRQAAKLVEEAVALSEKYGIPFRPKVGFPFRMSYLPESMKDLFPDIDTDFVSELTEAHGYWEYGGWQTSQTC